MKELHEYQAYMTKAEFEKSLNTLIGLLKGIKADQKINELEISELQNWCLLQRKHINKYPFKEIIPLIEASLQDEMLTAEEIEDIKFVCDAYLNKSPYFDVITKDLQILHGILHGILSDNKIVELEIKALKEWLNDHAHLESFYPYDEVYSLAVSVLQDGRIDPEEEKILQAFFADFIDTTASLNINRGDIEQLKKEMNIQGICALGPNIEFENKLFCFTGQSSRMKRADIAKVIVENGGRYHDNVTKETDYLIVGDEGNPCWAFSCYGRKIEKAINLRKQGKQIIIAHEIDFWDALGYSKEAIF